MENPDSSSPLLAVIRQRQCIRAFTEAPVHRQQIDTILETASWAPSGVNTQPWQVAVVTGRSKARITEQLIAARDNEETPNPDYAYYPDEWEEPYKGRRVACGKALYTALQIERHDAQRKKIAWENNYRFFGAPVGLFFFVDRRMNQGSWVDMGMFIQTVMLSAQALGLATCPQASLAEYPDKIRAILGIDAGLALVCGMSLGYADMSQPVNQYRLPRAGLDSFCHWYD